MAHKQFANLTEKNTMFTPRYCSNQHLRLIGTISVQLKVFFYDSTMFILFFSTHSERWWCTEYADEIHDVLRKRECERLVFEYKAPQMKWRTHILQFIVEVGHVRNMSRDTVHLG